MDSGSFNVNVYLTKAFRRLLKSERIPQGKFNQAVKEIIQGVSDKLGHKLHKKRIGGMGRGRRGGYRSISYYREGSLLVFLHLFPKNEKDNISPSEEKQYILVAKGYDEFSAEDLKVFVSTGELFEYIIKKE